MNKEESERLVRVETIVKRIDKWCYNHDAHHFRYNIMAWVAVLGLVAALVVALVRG
jgi:hypothetical protein